jgi:alkanesulfonate monooxygenase SsuD/methylene tetrahydromethanopterin reductase-like flavin-dependent oxidoreductase (luciferase family)
MRLSLKFDLRAPAFGAPPADLYAAAVDQCVWADETGFDTVRVLEHHGSADGYCPAPLTVLAAVAARTSRVRLRARALVLPLHDPVRVAEDAAVVDVLSRGRLELVVAGGYVASEFAMFGRSLRERRALVEDGVRALKDAWTGEPFTYRGRPALVALRPVQRPHPPIVLGGSSRAAALRAARIADGFEPTLPQLHAEYAAECARLGVPAGPPPPPMVPGRFLHVARDPEAAWRALGPHLLHEMRSYGAWLADAGTGTQYRPVADVAQLRATGGYRIVTPAECLALARALGPNGQLEFHPLPGGAEPELGWAGLRLFAAEVLPALRADGLVAQAPG